MSFKIFKEKLSLESLIGDLIKIKFPEGFRTGVVKKTDNPSHPYIFSFKKMGIQKELHLREEYLKFSKGKIEYVEDTYAMENKF